jgi:hypothetical protein
MTCRNLASKRVHTYRSDGSVEILSDPPAISCEPVLPGFTLALGDVW